MWVSKSINVLLVAMLLPYFLVNPVRAHASGSIPPAGMETLIIEPIWHSTQNGFSRIEQITPGDSKSSTLKITNDRNYAFTLTVEAKDSLEEDALSLFDALWVEVSEAGEILANFPISNGSCVLPDQFLPGSERILEFKVQLPCEAGNEYQQRKASIQWTFTAQTDPSPSQPGGGSRNSKNSVTWIAPAEQENAGLIQLEENDIPLGRLPEIPYTGGIPLWPLLWASVLMMAVGLCLLLDCKQGRRASTGQNRRMI